MVYRTRARLPVRLITVVFTTEGLRLEPGCDQLSIFRDGSRIYQVDLGADIKVGTLNHDARSGASTTSKNGDGEA